MILLALLFVAVTASALAFVVYGFARGSAMPGSRVMFGLLIGPMFALLAFMLVGLVFEFVAMWGWP